MKKQQSTIENLTAIVDRQEIAIENYDITIERMNVAINSLQVQLKEFIERTKIMENNA